MEAGQTGHNGAPVAKLVDREVKLDRDIVTNQKLKMVVNLVLVIKHNLKSALKLFVKVYIYTCKQIF